MNLKTIHDGQNHAVGTTKYSNGDSAARNRQGGVLGRSSQTFCDTRDSSGSLASATSSDAKLLLTR